MFRDKSLVFYLISWFLPVLLLLLNVKACFTPKVSFMTGLVFFLTYFIVVPIAYILSSSALVFIYRNNGKQYLYALRYDIIPFFLSIFATCVLIANSKGLSEEPHLTYLFVIPIFLGLLGFVLNHIIYHVSTR